MKENLIHVGKTSKRAVTADQAGAAEDRHNRHFLRDAVLRAADDWSHVGAVPIAIGAAGGEWAVDSLARGALGSVGCLRRPKVE